MHVSNQKFIRIAENAGDKVSLAVVPQKDVMKNVYAAVDSYYAARWNYVFWDELMCGCRNRVSKWWYGRYHRNAELDLDLATAGLENVIEQAMQNPLAAAHLAKQPLGQQFHQEFVEKYMPSYTTPPPRLDS